MGPAQVVVITGASAGIGRATAQAFGRRGAKVGLLARGRAGLEGAVRDVQNAGGQARAIPTDVSDADQVEAAAAQVEEAFGPIDVWINVAFTSVFAPFLDITPAEFARVTEVSYLGFVNATRVALSRMRPRDRGTIVQVGSALGERSLPLQSAYCGAKHAVNGFTSSIRTELLHDRSNVHITVVQMPAVNTPQFSWVLSRLPNRPQPVPPIYQPEVAARGVLYAADHPRRKQYWLGASTVATLLANKFAAPVLDRYLARTGFDSQQTDQPTGRDRPNNLWELLDGENGHDHGALRPRSTQPRTPTVALPASARPLHSRPRPRRHRRGRRPEPTTMNMFPLVRAAYAATVIAVPHRVLLLYSGRSARSSDAAVIRVLGTRHMLQAAVTARSTDAPSLLTGAAVDAADALSMAGLSLLDPSRRRTASVDGAIAGSFAVAGVLLALRASGDQPDKPRRTLNAGPSTA